MCVTSCVISRRCRRRRGRHRHLSRAPRRVRQGGIARGRYHAARAAASSSISGNPEGESNPQRRRKLGDGHQTRANKHSWSEQVTYTRMREATESTGPVVGPPARLVGGWFGKGATPTPAIPPIDRLDRSNRTIDYTCDSAHTPKSFNLSPIRRARQSTVRWNEWRVALWEPISYPKIVRASRTRRAQRRCT